MNNSDKVKQQISPSIKTNWSEVTHDSSVFLIFRDCLQLFWTDLAVFYCVYCKYFPHRSWAEKKRVELRRKQIKRRWKRLQTREGKHFGEVCLWTQLKIIIVKKNTSSQYKAWVGWKLHPRCREGKSFSCCSTELCSCCCFSVCSADVSHWWHTQICALARQLTSDQCSAL